MAAIALSAGACAPPGTYTLSPRGGRMVLAPPQAPAKAHPRRLDLRLADTSACRRLPEAGYDGSQFGLQWGLADRRLQVQLAPHLERITGNLPVPLLKGLQALHAALAQATARGCLVPPQAIDLLRQVVEAVPLASDLAQQILYGPYALQDYVDLGGPIELALTYALHADQPDRYDLGYVERLYRLYPDQTGVRGHLRLAQIRLRSGPASAHLPPPVLALPAGGPFFFRLFFDLRRSPSDHDVALVWAATHSALTAATAAILSRPGRCDAWDIADSGCLAAPRWVGLEARVRMKVEGRRQAVPLPATVEMALQTAGAPTAPARLTRLRVWRPYRGRETAVVAAGGAPALLQLVLSGGEDITWR